MASGIFGLGDLILRFLVFASSLVAVLAMVTSTQDHWVQLPFPPFITTPQAAKFVQYPAFVYFVVAHSVVGFYALISTVGSISAIRKPDSHASLGIILFDVLSLGITASAIGAAGGVAYIGLNGNTHTRWNKICRVYDLFCKHIAGSIAASLFGSCILVLMILLSVSSLSKKIPK